MTRAGPSGGPARVGVPGVRRQDAGSALDLAGLDARGADVETLRGHTGRAHQSLHALDVGVPAALGAAVRVRDVVTEARSLAADIAVGSHGCSPELVDAMEELVRPAGQHEGCAGWGNRSRVAEAARPAKMRRPVASDAPGVPDVGGPPWSHGPATLTLEQEVCMSEGEPGQHGRWTRIDAVAARRWAGTARAALAARRSEIDALNVFPGPDGDT